MKLESGGWWCKWREGKKKKKMRMEMEGSYLAINVSYLTPFGQREMGKTDEKENFEKVMNFFLKKEKSYHRYSQL